VQKKVVKKKKKSFSLSDFKVLRQDSNHWVRDFKEAKDRVGCEARKRKLREGRSKGKGNSNSS